MQPPRNPSLADPPAPATARPSIEPPRSGQGTRPRPPRREEPFPKSAAEEIFKELRRRIRGEVRFDDGSRALYAVDSSNYRQVPIGVVIPHDADDVVETMAVCRRYGAPVTGRGAGTSLAGQCCNAAVILDFSKKMNRLLELDTSRKLARVQPGLILDHLNHAARSKKLVFGPDPSTHDHCTLGGMIGNNSGGVHSVMGQFYGPGARTSDNVVAMEILTYDGVRMRVGATDDNELSRIIAAGGRPGAIYSQLDTLRNRYADLIRTRYPKIPRRVSGYNLDDLLPEKGFNVARALCGTEGTCATVLEATVQLMDDFPARSLVVLGFPDVYSAGDFVPKILEFRPVGLEGVDHFLIQAMKIKGIHPREIALLPPGEGWLIVEFGGETRAEADEQAKKLIKAVGHGRNAPTTRLYDDPLHEKIIWEIRDAGLGASARLPNEPDTWEGWEDAAVPAEKLGAYLREFRALLDSYKYRCTLYGHFGQGVVHTRIDFGLKTREGIADYEHFGYDAAQLVASYGGSLSGEHGDGQSRGELLSIMFGEPLVEAFEQFKGIWDPEWKMNPGKVVRPYRRDQNLRFSPDPPNSYHPAQPKTHFPFADDKGSFSYALERCVGVGKCRRTEGGTMCPSFMVTREEKHSTRGRARLLLEMLEGQVIGKKGWRDKEVLDALDLCLACKGCKSDCPVNVDMATYKAEFLSHYYAGRLRPRSAYSMGLIPWWARIASKAPSLANFVTQMPGIRSAAKWIGGISQQREIPTFAAQSFQDWFAQRNLPSPGLSSPFDRSKGATVQRVILWPDTFNNYLLPRTAKAAVNVLEAAGFEVVVPQAKLCCGRPLYDFGMLTLAKRFLRDIMETLSHEITAGTPIVGLEPSCVAVFRDELPALFPDDEQARALSKQVFTLGEFLDKHAPEMPLPKLYRKAILHGHCHQKAVIGMTAEASVLAKAGVEHETPDTGCCGMAGSFGFEREHYDISVKCGERVLLPAVQSAPRDTFIVTDGFSCREQIGQLTDRKALHLAELLDLALQTGSRGPAGNEPETAFFDLYPEQPFNTRKALLITAATVAGLALAATAATISARHKNTR